MRVADWALHILRLGVGAYLLFTAVARALMPGETPPISTAYGLLNLDPTYQGPIALGVTILIGVLGLWLIAGRGLVVAGLLVALFGLVNGIAGIVVSQMSALPPPSAFTLLTLGLRDTLVLASAGLAIAAFTAHERRAHPRVMFHREERPALERPRR